MERFWLFAIAYFNVVSAQECDSGLFLIQRGGPVECGRTGYCPHPYQCLQFQLTSTLFCCISSQSPSFLYDAMVCPSGRSAFRDESIPRRCVPNDYYRGCPPGFTCSYSATLRSAFCCSSLAQGLCPGGKDPFIDPIRSLPIPCVPGALFQCPSGHNCISNYCCPSQLEDVQCLREGVEVLCTPNTLNSCPYGSSCRYSQSKYRFICC